MKWNDSRRNVKYICRGAFADITTPGFKTLDNYKPTWTIAEDDHDGLYSFKKWFLLFYRDPTETKFVDECFEGDFKHWEIFKNAPEIKPYYELYKKEAEQRLLAEVMNRVIETAMDTSNKSSMVALKYLADRGSKILGGPVDKGGRPKKADIAKAAKEIAEESKDFAKDLARITAGV